MTSLDRKINRLALFLERKGVKTDDLATVVQETSDAIVDSINYSDTYEQVYYLLNNGVSELQILKWLGFSRDDY